MGTHQMSSLGAWMLKGASATIASGRPMGSPAEQRSCWALGAQHQAQGGPPLTRSHSGGGVGWRSGAVHLKGAEVHCALSC